MTHVTPDDPICALLAGRLTEPDGVERLMADVAETAAQRAADEWLAEMKDQLFRLREHINEATAVTGNAYADAFLTAEEWSTIQTALNAAWNAAFRAEKDREAGQ